MRIVITEKDAAATLETLIDQALAGEEVVVERAGQPLVKLVAVRQKRQPGSMRGEFVVGPEFFEPLPDDALRAFEGDSEA